MRGSYLHSAQRSNFEHLAWYAGKAEIREYLQELNKGKKVRRNKAAKLLITFQRNG
jgi:hypothetical protein